MEENAARGAWITWGVGLLSVGMGFAFGGPALGWFLIAVGSIIVLRGHFPNMFGGDPPLLLELSAVATSPQPVAQALPYLKTASPYARTAHICADHTAFRESHWSNEGSFIAALAIFNTSATTISAQIVYSNGHGKTRVNGCWMGEQLRVVNCQSGKPCELILGAVKDELGIHTFDDQRTLSDAGTEIHVRHLALSGNIDAVVETYLNGEAGPRFRYSLTLGKNKLSVHHAATVAN